MSVGCLPGYMLDAPGLFGIHVSEHVPLPEMETYWLRHGGWSLGEFLRNDTVKGLGAVIDLSGDWPLYSAAPVGVYCFQIMYESPHEESPVDVSPPAVLVVGLIASMHLRRGSYPLVPTGADILCKEMHPVGDARFSIREGNRQGGAMSQPFRPTWVGMGRKGIWLRHWKVS